MEDEQKETKNEAEVTMEIPLEVTLSEGGGGNVSGPFSSPRFPPGATLRITGASLREIRLVVGAPTLSVKVTLLDVNGRELIWPNREEGGSIVPPPPPVGISM